MWNTDSATTCARACACVCLCVCMAYLHIYMESHSRIQQTKCVSVCLSIQTHINTHDTGQCVTEPCIQNLEYVHIARCAINAPNQRELAPTCYKLLWRLKSSTSFSAYLAQSRSYVSNVKILASTCHCNTISTNQFSPFYAEQSAWYYHINWLI